MAHREAVAQDTVIFRIEDHPGLSHGSLAIVVFFHVKKLRPRNHSLLHAHRRVLKVTGAAVGHHVGKTHPMVSAGIMHGQIEPLDMGNGVHCIRPEMPGGGNRTAGEDVAKAFAACYFAKQLHHGFHVAPLQFHAVCRFGVDDSFFIELHGHGNGRTGADRIHAVTVAQFVGLDDGGEIAVHDQRPEGAAGFIFRPRSFFRLIRPVFHGNNPFAGHRTVGAGVGFCQVMFRKRRTAQLGRDFRIFSARPVLKRNIARHGAKVHSRV